MIILTNAFSLNMLSRAGYKGTMSPKTADQVARLLGACPWRSALGHAETAAVFSAELGLAVPCNRETVKIPRLHWSDGDTKFVVGQYTGPRLPEGATTLPEGASLQWWLVSVEAA